MSAATPPNLPLDLTLVPAVRELVEKAASLSGQNVSDFAVTALVEKARQVVQAEEVRAVSARDATAFLALLDADAAPNEALREAARRYREAHG